jgi:ElaB/YqjD/DUF883 family membrane-anchored ribosome-binding protein
VTQATDEARRQDGLKDQASEKVQGAAASAQEKAAELREQGSARLRDQFDQRSNRAGSQVRSLAEALRRSGDDLRSDGSAGGAQLAGQAAERIERLGGYLERKSGDELMRDVESFARQRPWMLAAMGMLAGVAAARFMKASSDDRYADYRRAGGQWTVPQGSTGAGFYGRGGSGAYGASGGYDAPLGGAVDVPSVQSDDPLARDPYAGPR